VSLTEYLFTRLHEVDKNIGGLDVQGVTRLAQIKNWRSFHKKVRIFFLRWCSITKYLFCPFLSLSRTLSFLRKEKGGNSYILTHLCLVLARVCSKSLYLFLSPAFSLSLSCSPFFNAVPLFNHCSLCCFSLSLFVSRFYSIFLTKRAKQSSTRERNWSWTSRPAFSVWHKRKEDETCVVPLTRLSLIQTLLT